MGAGRKRTRRAPPQSSAPALTSIREQIDETRAFVALYQDRVLDLLGRDQTAVKRFYQTFSICLAQEPKLATCTRASLIGAMLEIATLRLEPGVLGEAWPIPFRNTRKNVFEAVVIIGYKGLMKLARNTGAVGKIDSEVVFEKDDFDWLKGTQQFLKFRKSPDQQRGPMVAAWAQAEILLANGAVSDQFEVMLGYEITKIRDGAPSARAATSPWKTDEESMWRKTVLRRLCKFLPSDAESRLGRAVAIDELLDAGKSQDLGSRAPDLSDLPIVDTDAVRDGEGEGEGEAGEEGQGENGETEAPQD